MRLTDSLEEFATASENSDASQAALMWGAFVRYMMRICDADYMIAEVSLLIKLNTPLAWRVTVSPVEPFYIDGQGGDTQRQWQAFSRHLLAHCEGNNGYGIVQSRCVMIHHRRPLAWIDPSLSLIHPLRLRTLGPIGDQIAWNLYSKSLSPISAPSDLTAL